MNDVKAKILITADGTYRRGKIIDLKKIADEALLQCTYSGNRNSCKSHRKSYRISDLSGREIFYDRLIEGEPDECRS